MKKYLAILFFLIMLPLVSASSNVQISSQTPTWDGQKLTDYQGYKYSVAGNGLYQIEYSSQSTYFGFGLTGKYNGVNFTKLSTDYSWSTQLNTLSNGYEASTTTSGGEWKTNFTFTDSKTKILNTLTNILPMSITNAKFYYLFSVSTGDVIKYNGQNYTVSSSPNVHISGNLNSIVTATINNNVLFNFEDIISNGFNVTDVYIVPTSTLGFNSNLSVVAIGFTKGNGVIQSGQIITIDPQIYASNTVKYSDTGSVTGTATSYTKRKTLTMTDSYTGSWRILFDLRTSTAGTTVYGQVRKNGNVYGSEFSTTSASLQTESQNFTGISISSGDTIELWDYTTNGAVNVVVQNFYIEFDINITNATYLPLVPVISSITTGTNYINQSWQAGSGNITNYYNVSMNGTWYNGTTNTYFNNTPLLNSSSSNLIVWAINSSNATTLSLTALTNYTHMPVQLYLIYPNNCSTNIPTIVNLTWSEEPQNPAYTYQVSVNSGFSNIISSGSTNNQYSGNINLNPNTTYYWHVKNSTGAYLPTFSFLTSPPAPIPGRFNISVFDEVNHSLPILSYTAQVQNGSTALTKTTTTGWANFSAAEVTNGMYLI